jgi:hypothetical protein
VNPLLRRLATIDVRDVSIVTLEIEDVFLGYYHDAVGTGSPPVGGPAERPRGDEPGPEAVVAGGARESS